MPNMEVDDVSSKLFPDFKPEGFYVRLEVAGLADEEHGPFETRDKATEHHALAMDGFRQFMLDLSNGDGGAAYE